ncbi:MAG TPA: hypothetical protein DEH78_18950, partial [Solibacterales bacterium]|nr:hypothetical protein [Bryobacterales bacterium]
MRIALGAAASDVLRLVLRRGAWQVGLGLIIGMPAAFGLSHLFSGFLYKTSPGDPVALGGIAL